MRQKFRRPDGTEVEIEGTPEELAEYERQIKEGSKPVSIGKKKPVLRGAEVDGKPLTDDEIVLVRMHRAGLPSVVRSTVLLPEKEVVREPVYIPQFVPYRLEPDKTPCWVCGQTDCHQMHIWCGETVTVTSDSTVPRDKAYLFTEGQVTGLISGLTCSHQVEEPGFGTYEMYPKH